MNGIVCNTEKFIVSMDVGTTNIKCYVFDEFARVRGRSSQVLKIIYPQHGWVEVNPLVLWETFLSVFKDGLKDANIDPSQISCIGMSTQRGTFTTWDRETGQPFHNFIVWNDTRSDSLCKEWNKSLRMKILRMGASMLYLVTRNKRFLSASIIRFTTAMAVMKLVWVLKNIPQIRQRANQGLAVMGTVDSFLLYRMTKGLVHATEPSNACVTGLYDPFEMCWGKWAINMFNIPPTLLPQVKSTSGEFGRTDPEIFGASIPITAMVGDQQASTFGECCFNVGDVKCTLGTGSFLQVNTGSKAHASCKGLYPVVGWQIGKEVTYLVEGKNHDNGTIIKWAQTIGLIEDPSATSDIAMSVQDSNGVCFVPAFTGIQAPINDNQAAAAFVGLTLDTTKPHMIRAILEALAFRVLQMFEIMQQEADFVLKSLRLDGGMSGNDFMAQLISDLTQRPVDRPVQKEMSALGAAFLAGLSIGVWKDTSQLTILRKQEKVFYPNGNWRENYENVLQTWERAVARCLQWYPKD